MRKILMITAIVVLMNAAAVPVTAITAIPTAYGVEWNWGWVGGASVTQGPDTFFYGGTVWDAADVRWEAATPSAQGSTNRKMWTWSPSGFSGIPHSGLFMDGWVGVDNFAQAENYFYVADNTLLGANCVIAGRKSLFCGATNVQCVALCFVDQNGTGYGNTWNQAVVTRYYTYSAYDQITLSYKYNNESEPGYDFTDVILQIWDGSDWVDYDTLAEYTDAVSGTETVDVDSYMAYLISPVDFRIRFVFTADGGYSDEDGYFGTTCGGFLLDDYVLEINGIPDSTDFEGVAVSGLPAGWQKLILGCCDGDYAHVKHINDLPVPLSQDPCIAEIPNWCGIADSVLVFYDENYPGYPHPPCQDNYAKSPVIDFSDHPGFPGRYLTCERFANLPEAAYIFMYWQVRYKPGCGSGGWSPWVNDNCVYYTAEGTSCRPMAFDVSTHVPPDAEEAQVGYGVINYCDEDPWGRGDCTYTCNATPYFDNVSFGVFGSNVVPCLSMRGYDCWQDQFAEDGTPNPTSTTDTRTSFTRLNLTPPVFGDTLVCRTAPGLTGTEVWFAFRMAKKGPGQVLWQHDFFTTWFPGVESGGWREARMDIGRVANPTGAGTHPIPGTWMCTFHPLDPVRLAHGIPGGTEILPNNLFVPGTRIEYFLKACYSGSADTFYLPTGEYGWILPAEFEILPMMRDDGHGGFEWPCLIVADHFGQKGNLFMRNSDRIANHLRANNYDFDMFNKLSPDIDLKNGIARWGGSTGPGATLAQMLCYSHCMLNAGNVYDWSTNEYDVDMISNWLTGYSSSDRFKFFWASGDQLVRWLYNQVAWGRPFINNVLGSTYVHRSYALQNNDYTYCLPNNLVAGGYLNGFTDPMVLRRNGCTRWFNVLGVSPSTPGARAERQFDTQATARYSVVSNVVSVVGGADYRTLSEGYDNCVIRTDGSLGYPECGNDNVLTAWFAAVLSWAGYYPSTVCAPGPVGIDPYTFAPPAVVTSLAAAYPNPTNPTATIWYTVGTPGKVMLSVFDVSGRIIRTLVDEVKPTGAYSLVWDGTNDRGEKVASGVFFYQYTAPGYKSAKKLVIIQ